MVNNRIKELRKQCKLTLEELAAKLGVSYSAIQKIEAGSVDMDTEWMLKLSAVFNVKPYELLPKEWQPEEITPEEREILSVIRKTTNTQRPDNNNIRPQNQDNANPTIQATIHKKENESGR